MTPYSCPICPTGMIIRRRGPFQYDAGFCVVKLDDFLRDECSDCDHFVTDAQQGDVLQAAVRKKVHDFVLSHSVQHLMNVDELAGELGVSAEVLSASRRINQAMLIYSAEVNGARLYLRASVRQYIQTKDGRIPIDKPTGISLPVPSLRLRDTERLARKESFGRFPHWEQPEALNEQELARAS